MKKALIVTALLLTSCFANAYDSPSLETYDEVPDQFAYCSGVFVASIFVAQKMDEQAIITAQETGVASTQISNKENIKALRTGAILLGLQASALAPDRDFTEVAKQPKLIVDQAFLGDVTAQALIVEDMASCIVLAQFLKN